LSFLFIIPVIIYTDTVLQINNTTYDCRAEWPPEWNINLTNSTKFLDDYLTPVHAFMIYTFTFNYFIPGLNIN